MSSILSQTNLRPNSLELKTPQNYPLTSIFDIDPKKNHDFFAPKKTKLDNATLLKYQKTDFLLKILRTWLTDPSTPVPTNKTPTNKGNKATNRFSDQNNLLAIDENSDLLFMTTYLEFECDPLAKTQMCLPLKLLFAALYRTHSIDLSGHYGQERTYKHFKPRFYFSGLRKWIDLLIKDCLPCQTNKASRMDKNTASQLEFAETAERFNHGTSMNMKGPIHPASNGNSYIFVICEAFTRFVVTKPTPLNDAETAADV